MRKNIKKAVWSWQYNGGESYEWPNGRNPKKIIENRRKK